MVKLSSAVYGVFCRAYVACKGNKAPSDVAGGQPVHGWQCHGVGVGGVKGLRHGVAVGDLHVEREAAGGRDVAVSGQRAGIPQ